MAIGVLGWAFPSQTQRRKGGVELMSVDINAHNASEVWAVIAQSQVSPTVILESGPAGV